MVFWHQLGTNLLPDEQTRPALSNAAYVVPLGKRIRSGHVRGSHGFEQHLAHLAQALIVPACTALETDSAGHWTAFEPNDYTRQVDFTHTAFQSLLMRSLALDHYFLGKFLQKTGCANRPSRK